MQQSQLFVKTRREAPRDEVAKNAVLLTRAGFIHKEAAGVYTYLPLGLRVLNKIIEIIRKEMSALGGEEILMTALQDPMPWRATGRWDDKAVDIWFKTKLAAGGDLGLANTHEEAIATMLAGHLQSYHDLPRAIYQFQTKFRNEPRAKSGLLRTREFIMKDLYSFSRTAAELDEFYERVAAAYQKIFQRVSLGECTYRTFASGGVFSKYSHEFQTLCDTGEDTVYLAAERGLAVNLEVCTPEVLADLGLTKEELVPHQAIEVGNIFKLGTRFSEPLGLYFTDEAGQRQPVIMGSYGIGPGRVMGTVVEIFADARGLVWPPSIAPFDVHLVSLGGRDGPATAHAGKLYQEWTTAGLQVLWDDRELQAGEKFADSDLLGLPRRVIISDRLLAADQLEIVERATGTTKVLPATDVLKFLTANHHHV